MPALQLVMAPDPVFKKVASPVGAVTDEVRRLMDDMLETLHVYHGVGMAATMADILKRVVVIDLTEEGVRHLLFMADPKIIETSKVMQSHTEASLCYPGISAEVTRPDRITVQYLDYENQKQTLEATGFLAACIQHEMDYMDGKVYLDYLSKLKRDTLLKKMQKYIKQYGAGHACGAGCGH